MVLTPPSNGSNYMAINESGDKMYELSNHLGNVLNVVADRKLPIQLGSTGTVDYYVSNVMSYSDYYPFGMQVPNKHGNVSDFRYGFNGMESDDEVSGEKNSYDFGNRMFNPRIGRFMSTDKYEEKYPHQSPYLFAGNSPISAVDVKGDSAMLIIWASYNGRIGHAAIAVQNYREVTIAFEYQGVEYSSTFMAPDGTYTYYDLWPAEGAALRGKSGAQKIVPAAYQIKTELLDGTLIKKETILNRDVSDNEEGHVPDGVIMLYSDYEEDNQLKQRLENYINSNPNYQGTTNNCSNFARDGVQELLPGSNRSSFGKEKLLGNQFVTPNELFKDTKEKLVVFDKTYNYDSWWNYPTSVTYTERERYGEVLKDPGTKVDNPFIEKNFVKTSSPVD